MTRLARSFRSSVSICALVIAAGIILLPKDPSYASQIRFLMTAAFFAAASLGLVGTAFAIRKRLEDGRFKRWGKASSAVRDTLSFLRNEKRLAARGRMAAWCATQSLAAAYVLSHWPQAAILQPYQNTIGIAALVSVLAIPVLALRNRPHRVNAYYLRRYLREQLEHLGFRPDRRKPHNGSKPIVTPDPPAGFQVGQFKLRFDDLRKTMLVVGITGSGKTVTVLNSVLEGLIATYRDPDTKIAGMILDAKGTFYDKLKAICRKYGRIDDLFVLDPDAWSDAKGSQWSIAWNPLDNDEDPLEVASRIVAVLQVLGLAAGHDGSFFLDSAKTFFRHGITLVREAKLTDAPSIIDVLRLAREPDNETPLYHRILRAISKRYPDEIPQHIRDAVDFMENEWGTMSAGQKSAVLGTITQLIDEFQLSPFNEIFTQASTVSIPEILDQGKLLFVNMPGKKRERMSRFVCTLLKLELQRHVLNRPKKLRPSFLLIDEFQTFLTVGEGRGDSDFIERSRESNHANCFAIQNIASLQKHTTNQHDVDNFLGNCAVKCILRVTEDKTQRWASTLFGQRSEVVVSISEPASDTLSTRRRQTSYSRSARSLPKFPPELFAQLQIPIEGNPGCQEAESLMQIASREEIEHHRVFWPVNPLV